jgi:DNA-binding MarR family transcriptional regulator
MATYLGIAPSTMSSVLKRLEKAQLIRREIRTDNLRTYWISLRADGLKIMKQHRQSEEDLARELLGSLNQASDREQLIRFLEIMLAKPASSARV